MLPSSSFRRFSLLCAPELQVSNVWDPASTKGRYAVEMMLDRWDKPYCIKDDMDPQLCLDYYGMRKIVANPRKVGFSNRTGNASPLLYCNAVTCLSSTLVTY